MDLHVFIYIHGLLYLFSLYSGLMLSSFAVKAAMAHPESESSFLDEFRIPSYLFAPDSEDKNGSTVPRCPVLVFINSKSGGQLGGDLLVTYRSLLSEHQVLSFTLHRQSVMLLQFVIWFKSQAKLPSGFWSGRRGSRQGFAQNLLKFGKAEIWRGRACHSDPAGIENNREYDILEVLTCLIDVIKQSHSAYDFKDLSTCFLFSAH